MFFLFCTSLTQGREYSHPAQARRQCAEITCYGAHAACHSQYGELKLKKARGVRQATSNLKRNKAISARRALSNFPPTAQKSQMRAVCIKQLCTYNAKKPEPPLAME